MSPAEVQQMLDSLPEATAKPCNECPWRREALAGWLGPLSPTEWTEMAHGESPIACHKTLHADDAWTDPGVRQCAGAAIFRTNVMKKPRHKKVATSAEPDTVTVFGSSREFLDHHLNTWIGDRT